MNSSLKQQLSSHYSVRTNVLFVVYFVFRRFSSICGDTVGSLRSCRRCCPWRSSSPRAWSRWRSCWASVDSEWTWVWSLTCLLPGRTLSLLQPPRWWSPTTSLGVQRSSTACTLNLRPCRSSSNHHVCSTRSTLWTGCRYEATNDEAFVSEGFSAAGMMIVFGIRNILDRWKFALLKK